MAAIKPIITKKVLKQLDWSSDVEVTKGYKISSVGQTDGRGLWSSDVKKVHYTLHIPGKYGIQAYDDGLNGDAAAVFIKRDWDVDKHGLIYTDKKFLKDVRLTLKNAGIKNHKDIDYSEQGMQGSDYVHFDVGSKLLAELVNTGKIKVKL